ncbi:MAG: putative manganese transporter [Pseudomonadota bacterium]
MLIANLAFIAYVDNTLFHLIASTMADAYLGVSVFVALTLGTFYLLDRYLKADVIQVLNKRSFWQIPCAAAFGALPGCGGAIIVVTQFVHGQVSFGALVAVLIATMGDAAFLLLSREPQTAVSVFSIAIIAGIVFGYIVDQIHGTDYLKRREAINTGEENAVLALPQALQKAFWFLLLPGALLGISRAFNLDAGLLAAAADSELATWLGFAGAMLCIAIWNSQPIDSWTTRFSRSKDTQAKRESAVAETAFISVWVILAFMLYEMMVYFTGLDLVSVFQTLGILTPLLAVAIGFIPGCGPQILVTTLYLNGVVPLSAQLANAVSNDGDALFPALALAPKAAILATLYSAIPAIILGYLAFGFGY